jgi:hypothetical protein
MCYIRFTSFSKEKGEGEILVRYKSGELLQNFSFFVREKEVSRGPEYMYHFISISIFISQSPARGIS